MRSLSAVVLLFVAAWGQAQVRPVYSSIEADAASARMICVGKISKTEDVTVEGYQAVELTIDVSQTLKGPRQKTIKAHRFGSLATIRSPITRRQARRA